MNQQQVKYALERLATIETRRRKAITEKFTVPARKGTLQEVVAGISSGAIRPQPDAEKLLTLQSNSLSSIFDLSPLFAPSYVSAGHAEAQEKLKADVQRIRDELVLGDNDAALAMIRNFEAAE